MPPEKRTRVLAIIPARGGSKGLPQKNIYTLAGKPLIAYTIDAALQADLLDRAVVSTDAIEIADLARQLGSDVPFIRPEELAQDDTPTHPVLVHAVEWLEEHEGYSPDYVMVLQPTSPLRTAQDIDNCINLALEKDADGVVSMCETKHHPYLLKRLGADGHISNFMSPDTPIEQAFNRRQDLPEVYSINGAIYLAKREILLERQTWYTERTFGYLMPVERSVDIDSLWDLRLAEMVVRDGSV